MMNTAHVSQMRTKGWHYDVSDAQISLAQEVLEGINQVGHPIYYTEVQDPVALGKREFWICVSPAFGGVSHFDEPEKIVVASFDSFGSLVIGIDFLTTGGKSSCK